MDDEEQGARRPTWKRDCAPAIPTMNSAVHRKAGMIHRRTNSPAVTEYVADIAANAALSLSRHNSTAMDIRGKQLWALMEKVNERT